jgi:hypothetical protein
MNAKAETREVFKLRRAFIRENGHQSRGIDDHFGKPVSS